jgi:hypothetical protein
MQHASHATSDQPVLPQPICGSAMTAPSPVPPKSPKPEVQCSGGAGRVLRLERSGKKSGIKKKGGPSKRAVKSSRLTSEEEHLATIGLKTLRKLYMQKCERLEADLCASRYEVGQVMAQWEKDMNSHQCRAKELRREQEQWMQRAKAAEAQVQRLQAVSALIGGRATPCTTPNSKDMRREMLRLKREMGELQIKSRNDRLVWAAAVAKAEQRAASRVRYQMGAFLQRYVTENELLRLEMEELSKDKGINPNLITQVIALRACKAQLEAALLGTERERDEALGKQVATSNISAQVSQVNGDQNSEEGRIKELEMLLSASEVERRVFLDLIRNCACLEEPNKSEFERDREIEQDEDSLGRFLALAMGLRPETPTHVIIAEVMHMIAERGQPVAPMGTVKTVLKEQLKGMSFVLPTRSGTGSGRRRPVSKCARKKCQLQEVNAASLAPKTTTSKETVHDSLTFSADTFEDEDLDPLTMAALRVDVVSPAPEIERSDSSLLRQPGSPPPPSSLEELGMISPVATGPQVPLQISQAILGIPLAITIQQHEDEDEDRSNSIVLEARMYDPATSHELMLGITRPTLRRAFSSQPEIHTLPSSSRRLQQALAARLDLVEDQIGGGHTRLRMHTRSSMCVGLSGLHMVLLNEDGQIAFDGSRRTDDSGEYDDGIFASAGNDKSNSRSAGTIDDHLRENITFVQDSIPASLRDINNRISAQKLVSDVSTCSSEEDG